MAPAIKVVGCIHPFAMSRKTGVKIYLGADQVDWLDEQDDSNSSIVREAIDEYREGSA